MKNGKKWIGVKSDEARKFQKDALLLLKTTGKGDIFHANIKIQMIATTRHRDYKRDLDLELVKDCLQGAGIIANDRQIRREVFEVTDDVGEPYIDITLIAIGVLPWQSKAGQ
jgi:Holliday junction resolvase RusA-like endonuclease